MSWLRQLSTTYEKVLGTKAASHADNQLLPVSHTTQLAEIDVTVDLDGEFVEASVIELKEERETLIPCTEDSASRAGPGAKSRPHPLHDKLQYVAGDYAQFGGNKGVESHQVYMTHLGQWVDSPFGTPDLAAVYSYLQKGRLVQDLVEAGILFLDDEGMLLERWEDAESRPAIFKAVTGVQEDAFVRFRILQKDRITRKKPWENQHLIDSFVRYYETMQGEEGLDYATGEMRVLTSLHPKRLRHAGDGAKLISANDKSGFTFRGRFGSADEASQVSYSVSQQAHNALKWLIKKQGVRVGDRFFLVWGTEGETLPNLLADSYEILESKLIIDGVENDDELLSMSLDEFFGNSADSTTGGKGVDSTYTSNELFANQFKRALFGYRSDLGERSGITIMVLDAATPGRMAIPFYRAYHPEETHTFFHHLESWHERLSWRNFSYSTEGGKTISYYGAPSLRDIALVAFGVQRDNFLNLDEKVIAPTIQRLVPVVLDENQRIPGDIVRAAYTNACYPQKYTNFNWSKVCAVACSLIQADRNQRYKETWSMQLDTDSKDLTYNIGRWMAVLDEIELLAQHISSEGTARTTSVQRYFSKLAERPVKALEIVMKQLVPYRARLGSRNYLYTMEQEIASQIEPEAFAKARNLDGRFLLGFNTQKQYIIEERRRRKNEKEEDSDIENPSV